MIELISKQRVNLAILFVLIVFTVYCCSLTKRQDVQSYKELTERENFRIVFYNVENLFDTLDDPDKNDEEFTPEGDKHWNGWKYRTKLLNISKVIIATGEWSNPDIIGFCEIENRRVLNDLLRFTPLSTCGYEIIHKESPDARGIDVALLYKQEKFTPLFYDFINIKFPFNNRTTRDILYAKGLVKDLDTLHIFINHWPSRRGGKEASEKKRIYVASVLRSKVDSLFKLDPNSKIVILGDFNDEPIDKSILETLGATGDSLNIEERGLYNFMYSIKKDGDGSYKYKYQWNMLDQIIVSTSFFKRSEKLFTTFQDAHIYRAGWLLIEDTKYPGKKPFRTYYGPRYLGGYSDHLPVYIDIRLNPH